MRRKKGFTLIELIIILAIFGILIAILIPSWGYFIQRSRIRTQNTRAKALFNAAQRVCTDLKFEERKYMNAYKSGDSSALDNIYTVDSEWYLYWNGTSITRLDASNDNVEPGSTWNSKRKANFEKWNTKFGSDIKKIVDDEGIYKIYVKDYNVQSVVCSRFAYDRYIGAYPMSFDMIQNTPGVEDHILNKLDDIKNDTSKKVKGADMKLFDVEKTDLTTPE